MKTNKFIFISILALGILAVSCSQGGTKQTSETVQDETSSMKISGVTIDPSQSTLAWAGTMLGVYTHEGTIKLIDASLNIKGMGQ